ncbi:MAG: MTAP family purine nucleoside phosphorylase [Thermoplasmata archaeon]|nr:MAG: MTAP family purine nucleoside phosphorylase [Thermoplasmata archaeon]
MSESLSDDDHVRRKEARITMLGVIGGVGFFEEAFKNTEGEEIDTPFGTTHMFLSENIAFVPRHGIQSNVPPHKINHRANIIAFRTKGISKIIGVNSVGSLKTDISPLSILIPHDYINFWNIATYFDDKIVHIVPQLDENLRQMLLSLSEKYGLEVVKNGVYIQTTGPRLETKAEIKMLTSFGDMVGMTMASEATLTKEMEIAYASICSVDNYAHGITDEPLKSETIIKNARENSIRIRDFLFKAAGEFE